MSTANTSAKRTDAVRSGEMARKPREIKPSDKLERVSCLLQADIVVRVDEVAKAKTADDPSRRPWSRTDAVRHLILLGLESESK
jgi:hypothetical protein